MGLRVPRPSTEPAPGALGKTAGHGRGRWGDSRQPRGGLRTSEDHEAGTWGPGWRQRPRGSTA